MALRSKSDWIRFFTECNIPDTERENYANIMSTNRISDPSDLTRDLLKELGITIVGDAISIMKKVKITDQTETKRATNLTAAPSPRPRPTSVKPPELKSEMTHPEFRKYKIDWGVFKTLTDLPDDQVAPQIYNSCDSSVQNAIVNTSANFLKLNEEDILSLLESIVTKRSNPTVHRVKFSSIVQGESELIKDYLVRLNSSARDCEFTCPNCNHNLQSINVKDQFIRGIHNSILQTDILAKAETLTNLDDIVKHAEAFETAIHDQSKLQDSSMISRISDYKRLNDSRYKKPHDARHSTNREEWSNMPCNGCGKQHEGARPKVCPAWGQNCEYCKRPNHFASVCYRKNNSNHGNSNRSNRNYRNARNTHSAHVDGENPEDDVANAIIAHVMYEKSTDSYTTATTNVHEIPANITPMLPNATSPAKATNMMIFPDSGAGICLAGPQHVLKLGIPLESLIPCTKKVTAVGGSVLTCIGWLPAQFQIGSNTTRQPLYICQKINRIYFSRRGCTEVNILPTSFPYPMNYTKPSVSEISTEIPPARPVKIPFPPTEANVGKLKNYLIEKFEKSVFTRTKPFREMNCKPAHIHLKPDAIPFATHVPIPTPIHWKDQIKADLDRDVEDGIIEKVPVGEPVQWCSPMVVTAKKDGRPRRTVDLQRLNAQCSRETHHCESPFKLACRVAPNTKKTVLDATDGYHAVPLDDDSKPLTTFITEWGRYRYRRLPQGYLAAGDAYTRRYDEIIKDVKDKVKCIDDALLYDRDIESSFFHTWDYLTLCAENGITVNLPKFQFCQDEVTFAGLKITSTGICPADSTLSAIRDFPTPKDITGARSWFGLVNQISWAYSTTTAMQPFRELVKPNVKFHWNQTLEQIFRESKEVLIRQCEEGIRTFDPARNTCLQTDWSKEGIGYLLLQQHCQCDESKGPTCCKEGWKLVFAGSRFTRGAETRYAPTEGEGLAVAWSLEHARMFVLGCRKLTISTDHKPLLGIFCDRSLADITNTRVSKLKERTLRFRFAVRYNPGKWHRGPDAVSRNPVTETAVYCIFASDDTTDIGDEEETIAHCHTMFGTISYHSHIASIDNGVVITIQELRDASSKDTEYLSLLQATEHGFPTSRGGTPVTLRDYWNVRHRLSSSDGIVMMDGRIVIPTAYRAKVLRSLHSAHQGVTSMIARAQHTVYWPGMTLAIRNTRYKCQRCNETAPSQAREPLCLAPSPSYPFQQICMDYFELEGHSYLVNADRFSGWITVYHFPQSATSRQLISICRASFQSYGVSEELSSDGGPQFTSHDFKQFLEDWGVRHRISSVEYPQSNGRAEVGVKSAKRIIRENASRNGSLDNNNAARAILQYRNTPIPEVGLSPAQMLLHRQLRDSIPTNPKHYRLHKEWILSADEREKAFADRKERTETKYDSTAHPLPQLATKTLVRIQSDGKWNKTGRIVEVLPNRQYRIKVDGSGRVTLRNRRFLKVVEPSLPVTLPAPGRGAPKPSTDSLATREIPEASDMTCPGEAENAPRPEASDMTCPGEAENAPRPEASDMTCPGEAENAPPPGMPTSPITPPINRRLPKSLRDLADYNNRGLAEGQRDMKSRTRSGR